MNRSLALRQRLTAAATVLGTTVVMLALLAGMPYVLWRAADIPWPEHVSSLRELGERLTQPVSDPLVIELLAMVGWACWAAFTWTVVREIVWYVAHLPQLLRDRHAHREHLVGLPVKRSLAALCIGMLFVALICLWRPHPVSAQQASSTGEPRLTVVVTAPVSPAAGQPATLPVQTATTGTPRSTSQAGTVSYSTPPAAVRQIEYTVVEGDTLWDIAQAHLGDAFTWPRIYALNKDRVQSDGSRLGDPDVLTPGWRLTVPTTWAHPAESTTPRPATADEAPAPHAAPPTETTPPQPQAADHAAGAEDQERSRHITTPRARESSVGERAVAKSGPASVGLNEAGLIGITTAAGLLVARRCWHWHQTRQRDPERDPQPPALSPLVDKAAQAAHAATTSGHHHDPEALITRRTPPQPPRSTSTVTIGTQGNTEVSLERLAVAGGCSWTGPGAQGAARALLTGILTAAERQRPGPPRVKAVVTADMAEALLPGLSDHFTALTQSTETTQAIRAAEQHLIAHARAQQDPEPSAENGPEAANSRAEEPDPGTLLLLTAPDAVHLGQLRSLAARSHPGTLVVLSLDTAVPGADHWHIAEDGTVNGADGVVELELFRLTPEAGREMTAVLLGAHGERPRQRVLPTPRPRPDSAPLAAPAPAPQPAAATHQPGTSPSADVACPVQNKPVRLHVFGPITLYARGHQDPVGTNLRSEVHEFLALLAAHPAGLLASDIADKLHLDPGSDQSSLKNLRRAVRRALRAATGIVSSEFVLLQGELHKLHPELVETDLADFSKRLKEAFSSGVEETEKDSLAAVREALAHYRGPFAHGSDYIWADATREHLATQATDAALRVARRAERAGAAPAEKTAVLSLLEHLTDLHPDHERLAQHAIRLYQDAGRHDAAQHAFVRLERRLDDLGLQPDPGTRALIAPQSHSRPER